MSFTVRNSGTRQSDEVAQLYVRDVLAGVARPIPELAAFARITLAPGATQRVPFDAKRLPLPFLDESLTLIEEPGTWRIRGALWLVRRAERSDCGAKWSCRHRRRNHFAQLSRAATTSEISSTGTSRPAPVTPSVIMVMQKGHATAI
ncbi:MAG: hypothetical protein HEQ38_09845 [Gemmatimonas sp.]|nr:hypothetical protein [Gemmatimonas sp.]